MRNVFSLQVETKVSLAIIIIAVIIFLVTIFKSLDNFDRFINRFNTSNDYDEEICVEKSPQGQNCLPNAEQDF